MKKTTIKFSFFVILTTVSVMLNVNKCDAQAALLTLDDLTRVSTFVNAYDGRDFARVHRYHFEDDQGPYFDTNNNKLDLYSSEGKIYASYDVRMNDDEKKVMESDLNAHCYFLANSKDGTTQYYNTLTGRYLISVKKTASTWSFTVTQNVKNVDDIYARKYGANKLIIAPYTDITPLFVKAGDRVQLNATGTMDMRFWIGPVGPDGGQGSDLYSNVPKLQHAALIGKIGDGDWFLVGSNKDFIAPNSGQLKLMVNHSWAHDDEGSFLVEYKIGNESQPAATKAASGPTKKTVSKH